MEKEILNSIEDKYYGSAIDLGTALASKLNIDTYGALSYVKTLIETGKIRVTKPGYFSKG